MNAITCAARSPPGEGERSPTSPTQIHKERENNMQNLVLQIPDSVDIEELISGTSLKRYPPEIAEILRRRERVIILSEVTAEMVLSLLRVALSVPEERRVYLASDGERVLAAIGTEE